MKNIYHLAILLCITCFTLQSCEDQDDIAQPINTQINNFIWEGMNSFYLWQADVPDLADNRFPSSGDYNDYLSKYTPENLFEALRFDKTNTDHFSWIVSDYTTLEQQLQGTSKNNGIEFGLSYKNGNTTDVVGYVRYIISNSDAASKDIKRGDLFDGVNGTKLTIDNYKSLLYSANETYTLNFTDFNGTTYTSNGKSIEFTKTVLDENPILINTVINVTNHKIGYLMYNGFYSNYDTNLNNAFGVLKSQGVTDLVLDLRYNGGGSVATAARLASMITGQFTDQVFTELAYNNKQSSNNIKYLFPNTMGSIAINSLNLTKIYILTTKSTASASELIINGLSPYITVVQIGDTTTGKNVASITMYDSPDFRSKNRNPNHKYAMQPIVAKSVNKLGFGDYQLGIKPTKYLDEKYANLGTLGNASEPLLAEAIKLITGTGKPSAQTANANQNNINFFTDSKALSGRNEMHIE